MQDDDSSHLEREKDEPVPGFSEADQVKLRRLKRVISLVKKPTMKPTVTIAPNAIAEYKFHTPERTGNRSN